MVETVETAAILSTVVVLAKDRPFNMDAKVLTKVGVDAVTEVSVAGVKEEEVADSGQNVVVLVNAIVSVVKVKLPLTNVG